MLSAFIPPCHHSYLQCSHRGELHFKYCCWKRDLRLLLESCTSEPLAAIQAVTLSVLIPEPRGRPHPQLSTRCTYCDCTVILGELCDDDNTLTLSRCLPVMTHHIKLSLCEKKKQLWTSYSLSLNKKVHCPISIHGKTTGIISAFIILHY